MSSRPKARKRKGGRRVLAAAGVLAATLGSVKFLDLNAAQEPPAAQLEVPSSAQALSMPLALPKAKVEPTAKTALAEPSPEKTPVRSPLSLGRISPAPAEIGAPVAVTPPALSLLATVDAAQPEEAVAIATPLAQEVVTNPPAEAIAPATATPPVAESTSPWIEHKIERGESLARIFAAQELEARLLHRIVNSSDEAKGLSRIRPGQVLRFKFDDRHELTDLELRRSKIDSLRIAINDDAITVEEVSRDVDKQVATASGLIESSLFLDGQKAGLSDAKIMELATIFGWDIDFALEIRAGDHFRVIYEEHYLDGEKLRDGPILAAEFNNRGQTFRAVRYENKHGDIGYFDDQGHSKRRAFLRTPIKFARISSRFNPKRWHPVLKRWRSHKGVDYAAPKGTPIKASGDGRVVFRGKKGGYGKTVILQHAGKYTTLYAHMSGYSKRSRVGNRVKQGQVIGYVGRTGLASGPHLHYEFRVNGAHKDPLRVKLPKSLSLPKSEIAKFKRLAQPLLAQLEEIEAKTLVAKADQ